MRNTYLGFSVNTKGKTISSSFSSHVHWSPEAVSQEILSFIDSNGAGVEGGGWRVGLNCQSYQKVLHV